MGPGGRLKYTGVLWWRLWTPHTSTKVGTHCDTLNMVAERTVPTVTRLAQHLPSSATADVLPFVRRGRRARVAQDAVRRNPAEIPFRSKRRDKFRRTSRTENILKSPS